MSGELKLYKKIPASLRNTFWTALMDSVEDEILLMKDEISKKKTFLSYREADIETLLDLASDFIILPRENFEGIRVLLSQAYGMSDEMVEYYLRQELYKLPFSNKEKGTLNFYRSVFTTFGFSFPYQISIYRVTLGINHPFDKYQFALVRDLEPLLDNTTTASLAYLLVDDLGISLDDDYAGVGFNGIRPTLFVQQSTNNFAGYSSSARKLDAGSFVEDVDGEYVYDEALGIYLHRKDMTGVTKYSWSGLTFDENPPVQFNTITEDTLVSTKHVAFEIQPNKTITKLFEPYTVPYEALQYIFSSVYYYKRMIEVPHVGVQMTFILDKSGYWDTHSDEVITDNVVPVPTFNRDYIWSRGEGWEINNDVATLSESTTFPAVPPVLATPLVLPRKTLQDLLDFNLGNFETGKQIRFVLEVNTLDAVSPLLPFGLQVFTMNSNREFVRSVISIREAGRYVADINWNDPLLGVSGEIPLVGIMSYVPAEVKSLEVFPFDRFSIPELRVKCAMKQGIASETLDSIKFIEFGSGERTLPSRNDAVYIFPEGLEEPLARIVPRVPVDVNSVEFVENDTYMGAISTYYGQMINNIYLNTFPVGGGNTLSCQLPIEYLPCKKGTIVLGIRSTLDPFGNPTVFLDDGNGRLISVGEGLSGSINYNTGAIELYTDEKTYFDTDEVYVEKMYIEDTTTVREAGVWGFTEDKPTTLQLLAYATFAPVDLFSNVFHLNLGVILEK